MKDNAASSGSADGGEPVSTPTSSLRHAIASFRKRVGRAHAYRSDMAEPEIGEFMTHAPHTIGDEQSLNDGYRMLREYGIRHLPVLHGGKLVGLLSQRDLHFLGTLRNVDPEEMPVSEAMSPDTYAVGPRDTLRSVAAEMAERRCGSAVVVDQGRVIGIFTTVDALRALSLLLGSQRPAKV